ncbi:MAG: hypothetical protein RR565_05330 [Erysipelothrix sp.]
MKILLILLITLSVYLVMIIVNDRYEVEQLKRNFNKFRDGLVIIAIITILSLPVYDSYRTQRTLNESIGRCNVDAAVAEKKVKATIEDTDLTDSILKFKDAIYIPKFRTCVTVEQRLNIRKTDNGWITLAAETEDAVIKAKLYGATWILKSTLPLSNQSVFVQNKDDEVLVESRLEFLDAKSDPYEVIVEYKLNNDYEVIQRKVHFMD